MVFINRSSHSSWEDADCCVLPSPAHWGSPGENSISSTLDSRARLDVDFSLATWQALTPAEGGRKRGKGVGGGVDLGTRQARRRISPCTAHGEVLA
ncbi:hypothetical protein RRG08_010542 [Elysia crispata]|uniref:Uncharacterized protein n=1 Tax=Elysia crispata TaxID=231223 RepID=A0AAE1DY83_9GAST|nr:hypothetical protein RRG08_010542 [Elysia crispata]